MLMYLKKTCIAINNCKINKQEGHFTQKRNYKTKLAKTAKIYKKQDKDFKP